MHWSFLKSAKQQSMKVGTMFFDTWHCIAVSNSQNLLSFLQKLILVLTYFSRSIRGLDQVQKRNHFPFCNMITKKYNFSSLCCLTSWHNTCSFKLNMNPKSCIRFSITFLYIYYVFSISSESEWESLVMVYLTSSLEEPEIQLEWSLLWQLMFPLWKIENQQQMLLASQLSIFFTLLLRIRWSTTI